MEPLVSVVITTYKREPQIVARAVKSVLNQSYKNIELIVVDDSPADYSMRDAVQQMVQAFGNLCYIRHEANSGACVARNTGLKAAKGEFIAFLDDDDEWLPEKIQKQLLGFDNENVTLVYCGHIVRNDVRNEEKIIKTKYYRGRVFEKLILENFVGSTSFPLIRKVALEMCGGFDPMMQSAQDYDVWLRMSIDSEVNYVQEPLVVYHIHGGEQITDNPKKKIAGLERLNHKHANYLDMNPQAWHIRNIKLAPFYAADGRLWQALGIWWKCAIKCPGRCKDNLRYLCFMLRMFIGR